MLNLPKGIQRILDESVCPVCQEKADKNGVFAVGIREELHPKFKKTYLSFFFLYMCAKCKKPCTFSGIPTTIEDFIGDMIEVANSPMPTDTKNVDSSFFESGIQETEDSGISAKEIRDFKKMLNATEFYEDFLEKIGINRSDINKKDDKNDSKNK